MSLDFFNNLKESLEKNDTLSKITDGISDFIGELSEALQKVVKDTDIVTQIVSSNKLTIASENSIIQTRNEVLSEYANNTKEEGPFYFVCNKVEGRDSYRVWEYNNNKRTQTEVDGKDLPSEATVNSIMRMKDGKLVVDKENRSGFNRDSRKSK